ncbi:MAG: hypothetical protein CVU87_07820 [Firmicutes bacterium HGW-Firmicutes-12]|nr:MAG: hypothetical protein CVU87_07820 [Firmicutes bacterium HGW-Firmicutes-12]
MSHERLIEEIEFEITLINTHLTKYRDLIEESREREPDLIQLTALASVVHSFYNGIERIFIIVSKRLDNEIPDGKQWHRELVQQITSGTSKRNAVISESTKEKILPYLAFRHFYRHSYSYVLSWSELRSLINPLEDIWEEVKSELREFLDEHRE